MKLMKSTGANLVLSVLVLTLMTTGVVGIAGGYNNGPGGAEGILAEKVHRILASKLDMEVEELEAIMERTYDSVVRDEARPYRDAYLERLAAKVGLSPEFLEETIIDARLEAIEKLNQEGTISSELAADFRERANEFPFGYGGPRAEVSEDDTVTAEEGAEVTDLPEAEGTELTLEEMLTYALEDEYRARATYELIIDRLYAGRPFTNIVRSEQTHINLLKSLFSKYDLEVPEDETAQGVTVPNTIGEALEEGIRAEKENVALYEKFLTQDLSEDVRDTFRWLKNASENHLAALRRALDFGYYPRCGRGPAGSWRWDDRGRGRRN